MVGANRRKISIWRVNPDGTNLQRLTTGDLDFLPQIAGDGKWVYYSSFTSGKPLFSRVPIGGGAPEVLGPTPNQVFTLSPDGGRIAFPNFDFQANHFVIEIRSTTDFKLLQTLPFINSIPVWSPDGRSITYGRSDGGVGNVWAMPLDGGKPVQVTHFTSGIISRFAWSPDGKQLLVSRGTPSSDVVLFSASK